MNIATIEVSGTYARIGRYVTIPAGKHNGSGKVSLTSDIENALAAI